MTRVVSETAAPCLTEGMESSRLAVNRGSSSGNMGRHSVGNDDMELLRVCSILCVRESSTLVSVSVCTICIYMVMYMFTCVYMKVYVHKVLVCMICVCQYASYMLLSV